MQTEKALLTYLLNQFETTYLSAFKNVLRSKPQSKYLRHIEIAQ